MFKQSRTVSATIWALLDRFSTQLVSFIVGVVLARILSPNDYGIIGMTTIFIALSNVFIDSGFANALIRKNNRTDNDLSTAFYFNIIVGVIAYTFLYISAPYISKLFSEPQLTPILRIVGINILFLSLSIVQTALLTAKLNIRTQAIINLLSLIPASLVAIVAAYKGAGVYSLAIQTVLSSFIKMILLWIYSGWIPKGVFDKSSFNYLWSFGSKLLYANLIGTIFNEIYSVLIGKFLGKTELGYYSKASHLNQNVNGTTSGIVQKITLPVLARYQQSKEELLDRFSKLMRLLVLFIAPISVILFFLAKDIIVLLWGEKWIDSVRIFQLLIIGTVFGPISQMSLSLLQVLKRTDIILKLEFPKKISYCILIAVGFRFGVLGLAFVQIITNMIASLVNMYPTKNLLSYSYFKQLKDVFKYIIYSAVIGYIIWLIVPDVSSLIYIFIYVVSFIISYFILLLLLKDEFILGYFIKNN